MNTNDSSDLNDTIFFEDKRWSHFVEFLRKSSYSQYFILVDSNTKKYCLPLVEKTIASLNSLYSVLEVDAGEASKDLTVCSILWSGLTNKQADRKSLLINLGGGMVTDLGGFVASVYKRGIDFVSIPTSLLAMIDASIGGKCGIDFDGYKNQIGVFNSAKANFIFPDFLKTLPKQELLSGFAEMLKHALILDKTHWERLILLNLQEETPSQELLLKSIELKSGVVAADPKEEGERKKLNYGHTMGHALESYFLQAGEPIPHGFAVAAGMLCESYISMNTMGLTKEEFQAIESFINDNYEPLHIDTTKQEAVLAFLKHDKKNEGGKINFTLISEIGTAEINQNVSSDLIVDSLNYYFRS